MLSISAAGSPAVIQAIAASSPANVSVAPALTLQSVASVVNVGLPGPPGPAPRFFSLSFAGVAAGQTIALPANAGDFHVLAIQGAVEQPAAYSVSGATLIIPPGLVWDGASCLFIFAAAAGASAGLSPLVERFEVSNDGQVFVASQKIGADVGVYINGLRQAPDNFSVSGAELTLSAGAAQVGDVCLIQFTPVI